jgi:hypothetical protein
MHLIKNVLIIGQISAQVSTDQRERLTMSVERLNQSSDRIKESRRAMLETEELGVSVLEDLHQQRQTLLHAHNKVLHLIFSPLNGQAPW